MINNILYNWNLSRFIKLALGVFMFIDGIRTESWILVGLSLVFLLMPLLNIGCCSTGNCAVSYKKEK